MNDADHAEAPRYMMSSQLFLHCPRYRVWCGLGLKRTPYHKCYFSARRSMGASFLQSSPHFDASFFSLLDKPMSRWARASAAAIYLHGMTEVTVERLQAEFYSADVCQEDMESNASSGSGLHRSRRAWETHSSNVAASGSRIL